MIERNPSGHESELEVEDLELVIGGSGPTDPTMIVYQESFDEPFLARPVSRAA